MSVFRSVVGTCLICCFSALAWGAETVERVPVGNAVLRCFHDALDDKQFELAEIIARGVLAQHGADNEFGKVMLSEIEAVQKDHEGPRLTSKYVVVTKVYNLSDVLAPEDFGAKAKRLIDEGERKIGPRWHIHNCSAAPFVTNFSLVVSAPEFIHDEFATVIQKNGVKVSRN